MSEQQSSAASDVIDAIMTTRAMRRFSDRPAADADIELCLRAAQQGPSGGHVQPQQYVVVTDAAKRSTVGGFYRRAFDRYEVSLPSPTGFANEA